MMVVEVPVGKKIMIDKSVDWFDWFDINIDRRRRWNVDWDERWDNAYSWRNNVQYIMTGEGLERADKADENKGKLKSGKFRLKADDNGLEIEAEGEADNGRGTYRYKQHGDSITIEKGKKPAPPKAPEQPVAPVPERKARVSADDDKAEKVVKAPVREDLHSPFLFLSGS